MQPSFHRLFQIAFLSLVAYCQPASVAGASFPKNEAGRKPNVIVILSDDQGWGDLGINGNINLKTPNIDRIAKEGARFDRFFVCPVCSPTRAEFLTGRYHPHSGVYSTSAGGERIDLDEVTLGDIFKAAGYSTGAFGKWHNGMQYPYHPNGRGFDEFYGFCSGHWGNYFSPILERNGKIVRGSGFCVDDFTDHLIQFVEDHVQQPFFAYLPLNTPHSPMQVPEKFWQKFKDKPLKFRNRQPEKENLQHTRAALAMCENIDWNVGRILQKLEQLDIADHTIVVYFCDNGPNGFRWNGGMKGRKGSTDEGGVRSPLHIRFPDQISRGTSVGQIGAAIDLLPTLAEFCDVPLTDSSQLDGKSLVPVLKSNPSDSPAEVARIRELQDRLIVSHWRGKVSVRSQQYRLDHQGKLFDMLKDAGQKKDISREKPVIQEKLQRAADDYRERLLDQLRIETRPFLIGHSDFPITQVPARDATAEGNIKRSNRFPNCSFFRNWTDLQDRILWNAEVLESGQYEVTLYYTCPDDSVGSEFEIRFNGKKLKGKIDQSHAPPEIGAENDRVKRVESYVKDFKPLNLGTMNLEKGVGTLELQATKIPGKQVMEFRMMLFERK